jgi:DNA polymerase-4
VPAGQEKEFLAPLDIGKLPGVGSKTEPALKTVGITTIGQFADLPAESARSILGASGMMLYRHANGIDNRKLELPGEAKSISRETTFAQDTLDRRVLHAILRYLCERVSAELRQQNKQAKTVSLKLRYADFDTVNRSHSSKEATSSDDTIFATAVQLLGKALAAKQKLVRLLGVEVSNLVGDAQQLCLFDVNAQRQERFDKAIDRIRNKYGFNAIQSGRTLALRDPSDSDSKGYTPYTPSLSR